MSKVLNVIVLYDNYEEVRQYIKSVQNISMGSVDIAVVINKDSYGKRKNIEDSFKGNISIFDFNENVGYLNSLLRVLDKVDINEYEYIILSNTDIKYPDKKIFSKLLNNRYNEDIGCIAPDVFSSLTLTHSNPLYKEKITRKHLKRSIFMLGHPYLMGPYKKMSELRSKIQKKNKEKSGYIYSAHGCYLILTKRFVSQLIGKTIPFKLYSEEAYIAGWLERYSLRCFFDNHLKILHMEHSTTSKLDKRTEAEHFKKSLEYILKEFY